MAWEWHERERDRYGRFAARHKKNQLHLRLTPEQCSLIRNAARAARMETSAYVWQLIDEAWREGLTANGQDAATSGGGPRPAPAGGQVMVSSS